jgi:hypothetical protein
MSSILPLKRTTDYLNQERTGSQYDKNAHLTLLGCGVAQRVRCGSEGCGVAQIVAHRLAVRQARVRISARHPYRGGPLPSGCNEDNKSGTLRVVYINIVCLLDYCKNKSKRVAACHQTFEKKTLLMQCKLAFTERNM